MKESKHHTYDEALELIEQIIEGIDPEETVTVSDIIRRIKLADQTSNITKATIMLLKKYGIGYQEEPNGRSNSCPAERRSANGLC